jgi:hypothetical protein
MTVPKLLRNWQGTYAGGPARTPVIRVEGQQSVTGAEHRHAVGRILAGRHYGRIPGLLGEGDRSLQQSIESAR